MFFPPPSMRLRTRLAVVLLGPAVLASCLPDVTQPEGTPIDCQTLATSLATTTDLTTTSSGLRYRDLAVGTGATAVAAGNVVGLYYSGCLTNGVKFDERNDGSFPFEFAVGTTPLQVIAGFDEGLRGMRVGGRRQLVIPPELGYGSEPVRDRSGNIVIPANSTLVFTIELRGLR